MSFAQSIRSVGGMETDQHGHQHGQGHGHGHGHGHSGGDDVDASAMAELLDLDAEVLHEYLSELTAWIEEIVGDAPPRHIIDLGAGTGAGTFALLDRFEDADAVAVDMSPQLLQHLSVNAQARGFADRVRTVEANLDQAWPELDTADLVWASASLHHMADPDRVLTDVVGALRPGGLLVAVELDSFPRFLPVDVGIGRPGLEARGHAALAENRAVDLPTLGSDWGPRFTQAGFTIEAQRTFTIELDPPLPAATGRYAQVSLRRMRAALDGRLSADDLATLDTLLDSDGPLGILQREDLSVRAERTVWIARRV
jgi:SAM-dependent methyltransferase